MTQERWSFFFVLQVFWVMGVKNVYFHTVNILRDLVRQEGHVTTSVTFRISCSIDARTMIFFLFCRFLGSGMSKIYIPTQQLSRVTLYGHVTMSVTFSISCHVTRWAWPFIYLVLMTQERWSFFILQVCMVRDVKNSFIFSSIYLKNFTPIKNHRSDFSGTTDENGHA